MQRIFRLATMGLLCSALLAGCGGGGKVYDPLQPTAIYTFGDGIVDDGQTGGKLYTVNTTDAVARPVYSLPHMVASSYGLTLKAQSAGGTAWGQGGSKIADAVTQINNQINSAGFGGFGAKDVIMLSAGMEDLIAQTESVAAGSSSLDSAKAQIQAQVHNYGQAMLQLHAKGARYIYILPPYDLSQSPWMKTLTSTAPGAASTYAQLFATFASALDAEAESVNGQTQSLLRSPGFRTYMGYYTDPSNALNNAGTSITDTALCAGAGATNASLCTDATLITAVPSDQGKYLFADNRHPVPAVLNLLASRSVTELKNRWGEP